MKLRIDAVSAVCLLLICCNASAQTLFTYGSHAVTKNEFLQAYNKNPDTTGDRQQKIRDYLNLYINFRLKLQAAYDEKVNTNADIQSESENFKSQLTDNYINQQADINQLMHEAFLRSRKDILLQQVFVPFTGVDTAEAYNKIYNAHAALEKGKNFDDVVHEYANDSSNGMIGYVTVFTLPYAIENSIYALPKDGYSAIYRSKLGYHIFKNAGERTALGRRKIQQLIFTTPQFFTGNQTEAAHKQADSVYSLLQNGASFESFLPVFGKNYEASDPVSATEIKVGEYSSDFENNVFSLQKAGDISKPFKTEYGYNIIKLVEVNPAPSDENDVTNTAYLQQQIEADGRLDAARNNLVQKWLPLTHFKEAPYNTSELRVYTDSALAHQDKLPAAYKSIKPATILFEFEKKKYTVSDWIDYVRPQQDLFQAVAINTQYEKLMHDFIQLTCKDYYRQHIEDFDPPVKDQLKEFNDANMLFYVMDKHVWGKASQDSAGLKNYYNQHASAYKWNKSVTALVVSGPDKSTVSELAEKIKKDPAGWRNIAAAYGNSIYIDSGRFEQDQLPVKQQIKWEKDFQTETEANDAGDAYTFAHLVEVYPQPAVRNFNDAKGLVINDYQDKLEKQWVEQLKIKYPVSINEAVLKNVY